MFGYIYKITNVINNKVYIGQTIRDPMCRKREHFSSYEKNRHLKNAYNKYTLDNFTFEVIDEANDNKELDEKEVFWIAFYKATDRECGYNLTSGGNSKKIITEETRALMSQIKKGKVPKNYLIWNRKALINKLENQKKFKSCKIHRNIQDVSYTHWLRNEKNAKSIYCKELDTYYRSIKFAVKETGIRRENIRRSLKTGCAARGLHFTLEEKNMRTVKEILDDELKRQNNEINLIASENYCSEYVLQCCGHPIQNKYSEGEVNARYYQGCEFVDELEEKCQELACKLYHGKYSCVQAHSGSSANLIVYEAATKYWKCNSENIVGIGQKLSAGGHLTHFSKPSITGKIFESYQYGLDENELINYTEIRTLLQQNKGKHIILTVGTSAYSRIIDYQKIADFVKELNQEIIIVFDVSHPSALIVGRQYPNPLEFDYGNLAIPVLTTTTHKTLRGARHALIVTNSEEYMKAIRLSCFPFLQGGQLVNMLAGTCAALEEADDPNWYKYPIQIIKNMRYLLLGIEAADTNKVIRFVSGGSDTHLVLLDLKKLGLTGKEAETRLKKYHIVCNMNTIPGDKDSKNPSGIRLGTAAITTRGFTEDMCYELGRLITDILTYDTNIDDTVTDVIAFDTERFTRKIQELLDKVGPFYTTKSNINSNNSPNNIA